MLFAAEIEGEAALARRRGGLAAKYALVSFLPLDDRIRVWRVENHLIRVPFVRTDENHADFFTKVLPARKFFPLRDKIMNVPDHLRWDAASSAPSPRGS